MQLIARSLTSRSFLIQFSEVMQEFGREIPWLEDLQTIRFWTNTAKFRSQLLKTCRCEDGEITPYQFIIPGEAREYAGGVIHFSRSPENFRDRANQGILERFEAEDYHFISCLQVRDVFRGQNYGRRMMARALKTVGTKYPNLWGVVSDHKLIQWYQQLGAKLISPLDNQDRLWIVSWEN
ncbi:MAG: hypothetical protein Q7T49_02230 [bacterium]|nr:hypothetical protein [bacterium]